MTERLLRIAETLDQLISTDISARESIGVLYEAARKETRQPLTFTAAELLRRVIHPGDFVLIATGWVDQPVVAPGWGESDGPPGAVALARALRLALKAAPVIVTDECLVDGVKLVAQAAGFQCVAPQDLIHSIERNKLMTIAVLGFPAEAKAAERKAQEMLRAFRPAACVAIERGGENQAGIVHNMAGYNVGDGQAKLDALFQLARAEAIATVAVGDGGNEIGMANIAETVKACVPHGRECQCPCGGGVAAATGADALVAASISNWGAYAVAAMVGVATGTLAAINDAAMERRVLEATAAAGFHDPITGLVAPGADGCGLDTHLAMVTLIREAALQGLARG